MAIKMLASNIYKQRYEETPRQKEHLVSLEKRIKRLEEANTFFHTTLEKLLLIFAERK